MEHYFPTRKSLVLEIFIWVAILATLALTGYNMLIDINARTIVFVIAVNVSTIVVIYVIWFRTGYFVNEGSLIVKIGRYTERNIDIVDIISLKSSYSLLASPANSFRRLKVNYSGGMILISPARENEFLDLITKLNPRIKTEL